MASTIPLQVVPNQTLSTRLDGARYEITLKAASGVMAADIARNGVVLVRGARVVAGAPLLPYRYQESGNFVFLTSDGAAPWWELFGTQSMVYLTAEEIAVL